MKGCVGWLVLAICSLTGGALDVPVRAEQPAKKWNVLFIVVDDMDCSLGCYGNPVVQSPNIDKLAAKGMRFDRAYCQYPLCNPSRTSFLSGRRPDTTHILDNNTPPRSFLKDILLMPEYFRANGYRTARSGKLIHTAPGFTEDCIQWDWTAETNNAKPLKRPPFKLADGANQISVQVICQMAESKDQPFFIAAGFTRTHAKGEKLHTSFVPAKDFVDKYPLEKIQVLKEPADHLKDLPPLALTPTRQESTDQELRRNIADYYSCVSNDDAQVGVLMDAIDQLKLWDRTIVVFLSDHGQHLGEHGGLWRKETLFEQSLHVPFIVVAPGIKAGAVSPRLVESVDLYPTLVQLCGLAMPKGMEGTSFVPLLEKPDRPWKKAAYSVVKRRLRNQDVMGRSLCTERYRYNEWDETKEGVELYDLERDPHEFSNLAKDPKHVETVAGLRRLLREGWQAAVPPTPGSEGK